MSKKKELKNRKHIHKFLVNSQSKFQQEIKVEVKLGKKENNNKNIPKVTSGIKQGNFTLGVFQKESK